MLKSLITGATSQLGLSLVERLLDDPSHFLYILIRKTPDRRQIQLFWNELVQRHPQIVSQSDRIRLIQGDLTKRGLGISDDDFEHLKSVQINEVFHLAAFTDRKAFSKENLLATNYEGTHRLLRASKLWGVKTFNHLGWLYASPSSFNHQDDYLQHFETQKDYNNLNEFIHRMTTALILKESPHLGINFRIFQSGLLLDDIQKSKKLNPWHELVLHPIFEMAARKNAGEWSRRVSVSFPAAQVPVYLTTSEHVAHIISAAKARGENTENQLFEIFSHSFIVRDLLALVTEEIPEIQLQFVSSSRQLPSIERKVLKNSLVFFEYLLKQKTFERSEALLSLEREAHRSIPEFKREFLKGIIRNCFNKYKMENSAPSFSLMKLVGWRANR